ncbi:MAG: hypothetical protein WBN68_03345 [Sedimenticolaceae bacterium]
MNVELLNAEFAIADRLNIVEGPGFTVADTGKGDFWLVNDKGVKL